MASAQNLSFQNSEELTVYPPRSLGDDFRRYRRTEEWKRKALEPAKVATINQVAEARRKGRRVLR